MTESSSASSNRIFQLEAALEEARQALANEKNEWRIACNLMDESQRNLRAAERQVIQQAATIEQLTKDRDEYKYMYEGLCK